MNFLASETVSIVMEAVGLMAIIFIPCASFCWVCDKWEEHENRQAMRQARRERYYAR